MVPLRAFPQKNLWMQHNVTTMACQACVLTDDEANNLRAACTNRQCVMRTLGGFSYNPRKYSMLSLGLEFRNISNADTEKGVAPQVS